VGCWRSGRSGEPALCTAQAGLCACAFVRMRPCAWCMLRNAAGSCRDSSDPNVHPPQQQKRLIHRAQGRPLIASPQRDALHRVGPCPAASGKQLGATALWRQSSSGGLTNPKTGKVRGEAFWWLRWPCEWPCEVCGWFSLCPQLCLVPLNRITPQRLGFAVVELFAVSSESLKRLEKTTGEAHSAALAQVAKLQSQLAAVDAARQEAEREAALEWRRARLEVRVRLLAGWCFGGFFPGACAQRVVACNPFSPPAACSHTSAHRCPSSRISFGAPRMPRGTHAPLLTTLGCKCCSWSSAWGS